MRLAPRPFFALCVLVFIAAAAFSAWRLLPADNAGVMSCSTKGIMRFENMDKENVNGNRIYLVDQNDRVMALTIDGGVTLWTQSDLLHRLLTSPVLYNGNLVVGDSEGYLHWINVEDGRFVAQQKVDSSGFQTEPVAADGKLLIQAKDGTVYSITR